jgi:hypothetical protein
MILHTFGSAFFAVKTMFCDFFEINYFNILLLF